MSEVMMSSPHNFPFILYTEITKISYFSYENVRLAFNNISLNSCRIMLTPIYLDLRDILSQVGQNIKIFKILYIHCTKYMASSEVMTSSTHSFAYIHIDWSRNVLWKFVKLQSVITSLYFNRLSSGFHCYVWKNFTLSSKLKLNLLWSSSLSNTHSFNNWSYFRSLTCWLSS